MPALTMPCQCQHCHTVSQVFVELNELVVDKNQELQWKETARWIKFEEDVEEETDRWGKPHVASLSFRSLLELRKTLAHGREAELASWGAGQHGGSLSPLTSPPPPSLTQGLCSSIWTRRRCQGWPIKWWSRWSSPTRSGLRTVPMCCGHCCSSTGQHGGQ